MTVRHATDTILARPRVLLGPGSARQSLDRELSERDCSQCRQERRVAAGKVARRLGHARGVPQEEHALGAPEVANGNIRPLVADRRLAAELFAQAQDGPDPIPCLRPEYDDQLGVKATTRSR